LCHLYQRNPSILQADFTAGFRIITIEDAELLCYDDATKSMTWWKQSANNAGSDSNGNNASSTDIKALASLKYFNNSANWTEVEAAALIEALSANDESKRQQFFNENQATRRRDPQNWSDSPLAKAFTIKDKQHLLVYNAMTFRLRKSIQERGIGLLDLFTSFDKDMSGYLSASELMESLANMGMSLSSKELAVIIKLADKNGDGQFDINEFCNFLAES
jgi:hypothetical protein